MRARFAVALAGIAGIIIYGSLYPFDFSLVEFPGGAVHTLLSTWRERAALSDALANILLYIPFGFCAVLCWRGPWVVRLPAAITAGVLLSGCMEFLQLYDRDRFATLEDVRSNAIGVTLGAIAGLILERTSIRLPRLGLRRQPFVFLLLLCWAGYRLFPYAPVIDLHKYWRAVRLLLDPEFSLPSFLRHLSSWLAIALMLQEVCGTKWARAGVAIGCAAILFGRIFIDDAILTSPEVAGGALAILLWWVWLSRTDSGPVWIASFFVFSLILQGLAPYHFLRHPQTFRWIPFYGFMEGEPSNAVPSFFQKVFTYGALLWLLRRCGFKFASSVWIGAALLAAISVAHLYLPGRAAETTDVVVYLSMAIVFKLLAVRPAVSL